MAPTSGHQLQQANLVDGAPRPTSAHPPSSPDDAHASRTRSSASASLLDVYSSWSVACGERGRGEGAGEGQRSGLVGVPVFAGKRSAGSTRLVDILQAAEVAGRRGLAAVDPTRADEQQHASRRHHGAAPHCGSRSAGSQVKNRESSSAGFSFLGRTEMCSIAHTHPPPMGLAHYGRPRSSPSSPTTTTPITAIRVDAYWYK